MQVKDTIPVPTRKSSKCTETPASMPKAATTNLETYQSILELYFSLSTERIWDRIPGLSVTNYTKSFYLLFSACYRKLPSGTRWNFPRESQEGMVLSWDSTKEYYRRLSLYQSFSQKILTPYEQWILCMSKHLC